MEKIIHDKIKNISINKLTTYANMTGCGFEFGNGGTDILIIPPGCNR